MLNPQLTGRARIRNCTRPRQQILVQAGTSVLAQANQTTQSVLKLLS